MVIKEITIEEFEKKFPEVSIYSLWKTANYLEDGTILLPSEWNGDEYIVDGKSYKPIFKWHKDLGFGTAIGFERR